MPGLPLRDPFVSLKQQSAAPFKQSDDSQQDGKAAIRSGDVRTPSFVKHTSALYVPNFTTVLPPSPPRSRSTSPRTHSVGSTAAARARLFKPDGTRLRASASATAVLPSPPAGKTAFFPVSSMDNTNDSDDHTSMSSTATTTLTAAVKSNQRGSLSTISGGFNPSTVGVHGILPGSTPSALAVGKDHSVPSPVSASTSQFSPITELPLNPLGSSGSFSDTSGTRHRAGSNSTASHPIQNGHIFSSQQHPTFSTTSSTLYSSAGSSGHSQSQQQQTHRHVHYAAPPLQPVRPSPASAISYEGTSTASKFLAKASEILSPVNGQSALPNTNGSARLSYSSSHNRRKSIAQAVVPSISTVRFTSYCALWYTSSALSSNTGKSILNRFRYPVTLTFIQFGFVAGWCVIFLVGRAKIAQVQALRQNHALANGHSKGKNVTSVVSIPSSLQGWGIQKPTRHQLSNTLVMSFFQVGGHIFSSMAIARVPVSTVHTIKALSPLFTVISYAMLFGARYTSKTYVSLAPLTLGVMLACSFDLSANAMGFLCALGSTFIFVSQNIFSKKLLPKDGATHHDHGIAGGGPPGERKLDKLHLLLYSSGVAFLGMIPLWTYYDGSSMLFGSATSAPPRTATFWTLAVLYTINGSVHFLQNLLAFAILALTSPVTYSIASLIKRIAVICMAIVWFGQHIYTVQAIGISMTFFGLWLYNQAKGDVERGEGARIRHERRNSVLLPTSASDSPRKM